MFCCFTGHRPEGLPWIANENDSRCLMLKKLLSEEIDNAVKDGIFNFYSGMARGIDTYAAEIVLQKSAANPSIKLHAALPCPNQSEHWNAADKARYEKILKGCATKTTISPFYSKSCMLSRNRFMVDNSKRIIAVWNGNFRGGTAYTVRYAKKENKEVHLINPFDL